MVVRWKFDDPAVPETYVFAINPNEGGTPGYKKNVTQTATTAPDGGTLLFEGHDSPETYEFSGTILIQAHHEALLLWWRKRRQIKVTDDLGRETWIYFVEYTPKRVRSALYPYKHTFTARAVVIETV